MKNPEDYKPVLAKITKQGDLGKSTWHEIVYFNEELKLWGPYGGSDTFLDGEKVIAWSYVDEIPLDNSSLGECTVVIGDKVEVRNFTPDIDGYIEDMERIMNSAKDDFDFEFSSMVEFAVKTAKKYKDGFTATWPISTN